MKKYFLLLFLGLFTFSSVNAAVEDNSIIDELQGQEVKTLTSDFKLKSFNSCDNMENVMNDYIKTYWKNNKDRFYNYGPVYYNKSIDEQAILDAPLGGLSSDMVTSQVAGSASSSDFGKTNTQVAGVDESDIIKTDGKNIYYYNDKDHYVYIVGVDSQEILKKIKVPDSFYNPVLYLGYNSLTIISSGYSNYDYSSRGYYINRNNKTYVIVFNIADVTSPKLEKLYITDGDFTQSRKIGDYVYVISNNYFNIPYYTFKTEDDIDFTLSKTMPQKIDISKTSVKSNQNLKIKGTTLPYSVTAGNVADCTNISYVLPDAETVKQYEFNPSYNVISVIDTKNTSKKVETTVIAGSNNEIFMSLDNLYLTSQMYESYNFSCPINARCFAPWFPKGANTLLHKLNISGNKLNYQDSTIIPGTPLTQYSMDEYKTDFRILTQTNNWNSTTNESYTNLYILDKNLDLKSSLTNLGNGEQFKSSRYIGDKLFLVTFKQVDPLFVIDVADSTKPKILGELKIPGYSTYLHPYDANHLIGLGYDTTENQWGGTINSGIKVDLYEINYDKKCGDSNLTSEEKTNCDSGVYKGIIVKQKYTKTFGGNGSTSEALDNPRMFMWKASDKKLFLPVSLYQSDKTDIYRYTDFFNGLLVMTIDNDSGIKENYRITHIDTAGLEDARVKECSKYTVDTTQNSCVKLINGTEYCENKVYSYVPKYCYAGSTVGEYLASVSWNYYQDFIKRGLWIGDNSYAVSNSYVSSNNISTGKEIFKLKLK
ncbi:MAG: beta-propeller domain-containing protein [Candidatus Gracilibacteria bacterium]|nr:beta-propeller domain-containing protein [Candidatus Gracilibacteria bacterium]